MNSNRRRTVRRSVCVGGTFPCTLAFLSLAEDYVCLTIALGSSFLPLEKVVLLNDMNVGDGLHEIGVL